MAYDVTNFITFMQRRFGAKAPDTNFRNSVLFTSLLLLIPLRYVIKTGAYRNAMAYWLEAYAVRDGLYYKHFRKGQKSIKTDHFRGKVWNWF